MTYKLRSHWKPLNEETISGAPNTPGVYQIRCSNRPIQRLLREDEEGILDTGESSTLRTRLRTFLACASGRRNSGHAAGWRFDALSLGRRGFKIADLQIRWKTVDTKKEAYHLEGELLRDYSWKFGELPPLNYKFNWSAWD